MTDFTTTIKLSVHNKNLCILLSLNTIKIIITVIDTGRFFFNILVLCRVVCSRNKTSDYRISYAE